MPTIQAKKGPKLPQKAKHQLKERYGTESEQIIGSLQPLYQMYKKGRLSYQSYHNSATAEFINGKRTPQLKNDILQTWKSMPLAHRTHNPMIEENTNIETSVDSDKWVKKPPSTDSQSHFSIGNEGQDLSTSDVTTQTNTISRKWKEAVGDKGTSGLGNAAYDYGKMMVGEDTDGDGVMEEYSYFDNQKTKATVGVYGSAWSYMRFFDRFSSANSGLHEIRVNVWDMDGDGTTGGTTLSIYVEHPDGYINQKQVDSITNTSNDTGKYTKSFDLDAYTEYKVGFELHSTTQTGGGAGSSDYYSNDRGVHPNHTDGEVPTHYYYEIETP